MLRRFVRKPASGDSRGSCLASRRHKPQMCTVKDAKVTGKWKINILLEASGHFAAVNCWCRFAEKLSRCTSVQERTSRGAGATVADTRTSVRHRLGSELMSTCQNSIRTSNTSRLLLHNVLIIISGLMYLSQIHCVCHQNSVLFLLK